MRKIPILFIFTFVSVFCVCSVVSSLEAGSLAEAEEETIEGETEGREEIKFRSLDWGITYTEANDYSNSGLRLNQTTIGVTTTYSVKDITLGYGLGLGQYFYNPYLSLIALVSSDLDDVAGHKPSNTTLYFAYVPISDTILVYDDSRTSLYGAQYEFQTYSADDLFLEMEGKLESVYGEKDDVDSFDVVSGKHFNCDMWYGGNDTELVLRSVVDPDSDDIDHVYISYAWKEGDDLLRAASKTITNREEYEAQEKETSVNGL